MNGLNFTVFDFETSGLSAVNDQIIEACIIRVRDGIPVSVYNTLVQLNEGVALAPRITELTGHSEADLKLGIDEETLAYLLWGMIPEDEVLVAYNALFDLEFLANLWSRYKYLGHARDFDNQFIDPLTIARARDPYPHKLVDSCKRHGIAIEDAHSAYGDTFALVDLVIDQHTKKDISEWVNVVGYRPKYGEPSWLPWDTTLIKQGSEVIEHSKKPVGRPKFRPVTVATVNKREQNAPDDPIAFDKKCMPAGMVYAEAFGRIDAYLANPKSTPGGLSISVLIGDELDSVMSYLTVVKKIPEQLIDVTADTPVDAIIEFHLPF